MNQSKNDEKKGRRGMIQASITSGCSTQEEIGEGG